MSAHAALLEQWSPALAFLLGLNGRYCASRIHEVHFPQRFPLACEGDCRCSKGVGQQRAARALGAVLGVAIVKAYRNRSKPTSRCGQIGGCGPLEQLTKNLRFLHITASYGQQICDSAYGVVARVLELAMLDPDGLSTLHGRLDALNSTELYRLALEAIQGLGSDALLADLLEPSAVAK